MATQLKFYRGDSWIMAYVLQDAAGSPIDLTGASARLQVRDQDGALVIEASTSNGRMTITPAQGRIDMAVPYTATQITPGAYRFDLEVTHASGVRRTYRSGTLIVQEDISRD